MSPIILDLRKSKKTFVVKQPNAKAFINLAASTALFLVIMALIVYGIPLVA